MQTANKLIDLYANWLEEIKSTIIQNSTERENVVPLALLRGRGDPQETHIIALPFSGEEEKRRCVHAVRAYCVAHEINHVALIMEAYILKSKNPDEVRKVAGKVKDHPERKECVVVFFESVDHPAGSARAEITRDAKTGNKIIGEFEQVMFSGAGDGVGGTMSNLLSIRKESMDLPEEMQKFIREVAKLKLKGTIEQLQEQTND